MNTEPNLEEVTRILRECLPAHYGAVLFGSRATGKPRSGSDWDIGLIGPRPLAGAVVETIREELEELPTLHSFDVVDLATTSAQFRGVALRGARAIVPAAALENFVEVMTMPVTDEVDLSALKSALTRLQEVLAEPKSDLIRDAAIQRFEFSFELGWKSAARVMRKLGIDAGASPRQLIRTAFKLGWISDDTLWLEMLNDRNRTAHVYNEAMADEIYAHIPNYHPALAGLLDRLKQELEN